MVAPPAAAVPAERAVAGDDPMARDQEANGVPPDRAADGPRRPGPTDRPGDLAVAPHLAARNRPDGVEDGAVPGRAILEVDRQAGEGVVARPSSAAAGLQRRGRRPEVPYGVRVRVLRPAVPGVVRVEPPDGAAEPALEAVRERLAGRHQLDRDDPAGRGRDVDGAPRRRHGRGDDPCAIPRRRLHGPSRAQGT